MRRIRIAGVRPEILQTFRLSHALVDAGVPIAVERDEVERYQWLDKYFDGLDWKVSRLARPVTNVQIDHEHPATRVGAIERPLIFAHGIVDRCRQKWASDRAELITFTGLMTAVRRKALSPLLDAFGDHFHLVATNAGRSWPSKAWDDEYFLVLGRSQLTACPDGDFIWTYRFFEAALCGSIPVVQNECAHYEGFRYYRICDPPASMRWRSDWAEQNQALALERLTVPVQQLRDEVDKLSHGHGR